MDRVKNILQRLQELYYSKHQKSAIDVDLMLDYTRVMYADLLEWRKEFKEEPLTAESATANKEIITSEAAQQAAVAVPEEPPAVARKEEPVPAVPEAVKEEEPVPEENQDKPATQAKDQDYQRIQHDDPGPKEPVTGEEAEVLVTTEPEKEYMDTLQMDASGISFEPPAAPEARNEVKEDLLVAEPAVNTVIEEIPAPAPVAIPLPDMSVREEAKPAVPANLFSAVKTPKDIRSAIGINDKYLFLNELFNNHKSNYEEALDQLNHFSTAAQAEDWIRTKVAPAHKWEQDDATVASFYGILKRHFSDR